MVPNDGAFSFQKRTPFSMDSHPSVIDVSPAKATDINQQAERARSVTLLATQGDEMGKNMLANTP